MDDEEKKLSIWAGTLPNISYEQFLDEWMEEKYDTGSDETDGFSKFMRIYKTGWYDHDFQDICFVEVARPFSEFVKDCSFSESYSGAVIASAEASNLNLCNTIIVVFDYIYPDTEAKKSATLPLKFLGSFPYVVTFSEELNKILNMKTGHE